MAIPNAYIIGIQKAGTTTLHDWIIQHPEVYGPPEFKDYGFFIRFKDIDEITKNLNENFPNPENKPIVLHSHANYIFNPEILERISIINPNAKLIVALRNPVHRCFSAYHYFKKMKRETRTMEEALVYQPEVLTHFTRDDYDLRYIEHGFYAQQLENCMKFFKRDQILILDFEELKNSPEAVGTRIFDFLGIEKNFKPDYTPKNITGSGIKNEFLQNTVLKSNPLKKAFISIFINWWFPIHKRRLFKQKILEWNTHKKNTGNAEKKVENKKDEVEKYLKTVFADDIALLDKNWGTHYLELWNDDKNKS